MELRDVYSGEVVEKAFASQRFVPVECKKEPYDPSTKTERGYIPLKDQVIRMAIAGERNELFRRAYAAAVVPDDGSEPEIDPTKNPGFDLADATAIQRLLFKKAADVKAAVQRKRKEESDAAEKKRQGLAAAVAATAASAVVK